MKMTLEMTLLNHSVTEIKLLLSARHISEVNYHLYSQ